MGNAAKLIFLPLALVLMGVVKPSYRRARVQFFGDVYIPQHVLKKTNSNAASPRLFSRLGGVLQNADVNVVNFEGVTTTASFPHTFPKAHLLKMSLHVSAILRNAGIHVATLANNHAMDFGPMGLFDSITALEKAGIQTVGAGRDIRDAVKPLTLHTKAGRVCILAFSRTLPETFWATDIEAGTSNLDYAGIKAQVNLCALRHNHTFVVFHWGEELKSTPKAYQIDLAHIAIDAGASGVIGHHPHVLQSIEFYKNRPILYSVGNFVFGTTPYGRPQEGMAAKFELSLTGKSILRLIPLQVQNDQTHFYSRPLEEGEPDPIASLLPESHPCQHNGKRQQWTCQLAQ